MAGSQDELVVPGTPRRWGITMNYLAVIPARSGSKGLPNKNTANLAGKPLIGWSIEHALNTPSINEVCVSTDSEDIAKIAEHFGASVPFLRPRELAQDITATEPVLLHALDWYEKNGDQFDAIVLLQPTSPLRHAGRVEQAIKQFESQNADSLLSVCESHAFFWIQPDKPKALYDFQNRPRRQDILQNEKKYQETGSIYISRTSLLKQTSNRLGGKISMLLTDEDESWEIDSAADIKVMDAMMRVHRDNDY